MIRYFIDWFSLTVFTYGYIMVAVAAVLLITVGFQVGLNDSELIVKLGTKCIMVFQDLVSSE